MTGRRTFLLEIGCEEIPASMIPAALEDLSARLLSALAGDGDGEGLGGRPVTPPPFGGPRRLVAVVEDVLDREPDRVALVTGPPVRAAFDPDGRPTKAALGFAKAQGVEPGSLERVQGDKGEVVAARKEISGRRSIDVLREACPGILSSMRFPKMMKWGDKGHCFVRPVHWILALLDGDVVEFEFAGVRSGRQTRGHRFLAPGPHAVARASDYEPVLTGSGGVIPGNAARRDLIRARSGEAARSMGWEIREDEDLLEELTFLNESPGVLAGTFPQEFLELPEPVLVTSMKHHQKYFTVTRPDGGLAAGFVAVINQGTDPDGLIRRGNEWVLKARLADAGFFWKEDRKRPLADRLKDLERVTFHVKLGHNLHRSQRLEEIAGSLAEQAGVDAGVAEGARAAARLCKADLTTGMVGEFPELQGIMGGIYALEEGLPGPVAAAISEHYLPTSTAGRKPATTEGCLVALADKLDLLAGCFASGLIPKGSADPYGLRRAAQGACLVLTSPPMIEAPGRILLRSTLERCLDQYRRQGIIAAEDGASCTGAVMDFMAQRLRFMMEESGMRFDTARAIIATGLDDVRDAWARAEALSRLRQEAARENSSDFESLATSAKRIRNIIAQAKGKGIDLDGCSVDPSRLEDAEEKDLHAAISRVAARVERLVPERDYASALKEIASLRPGVDRFFDKVLVMSDDPAVRVNRLALVASLLGLLSGVADFSEIVVDSVTSEGNE